MPALATVLYPDTKPGRFDMDYYLNTHMPLVQKNWGSSGLKSWSVTRLDPSGGYIVQASLFWDGDVESFQKAAAAEPGLEIMKDVPKFTDIKPIIVVGNEVAKS